MRAFARFCASAPLLRLSLCNRTGAPATERNVAVSRGALPCEPPLRGAITTRFSALITRLGLPKEGHGPDLKEVPDQTRGVSYWRYSVPYAGSLEDLLAILSDRAPEKAAHVAIARRRVEHGLLSVGLKVHYLGRASDFTALVQRLGGAARALEINVYKHAQASFCLVLPPVGSARAAILLLECIERYVDCTLFGNSKVQVQVCSPGRLDACRSALLGIGFYLGSDTLRRYAVGDFETTVSRDFHYHRGQRLVIYDAGGAFERGFEWWERSSNGRDRMIRPRLPFEHGRSDLLTGSGSRLDIENINLLATLLVHAQYSGYWSALGLQFEEDMHALLDRHLLAGLIVAPWVRSEGPERAGDRKFFDALQELVAYVFDEAVRVSKNATRIASNSQEKLNGGGGILQEMQVLLSKYRSEVVKQSRLVDKGDRP